MALQLNDKSKFFVHSLLSLPLVINSVIFRWHEQSCDNPGAIGAEKKVRLFNLSGMKVARTRDNSPCLHTNIFNGE